MLHEAGVQYVLIGGLAMQARGSSHLTRDVDVLYSRETSNLTALAHALQPIKPYLRDAPPELPFYLDERLLRATINLTLTTELGELDLLAEAPGTTYEIALRRSELFELFGVPVRVASLDDLIAMKKAADRPKDKSHLFELLAIKKLQEAIDK